MNIGSYALLPKKKLNILQERINELELQVNTATDFVKEIEKGNWNASDIYATGSNLSALTESLVSLCNQLKTYALQEKERNWVTEGLAKFIDILRSSNDNLHELTDKIISSLVKYMGVNQGALYI
ncbi:MAG TPA: hypothetical protein VL947_11605, partial [Cytophagales bacterium]|nr:hypothetical protein [Cytophagales bacterium]